jgi:osmoprotectant transport system substrate-binding protein
MKRITLAIMLTVWGSALAACGSSSSSSSGASSSGGGSGSGGSTAAGGTANCPAPSGTSANGNGTKLSIGSKSFAEEQILAEIAKVSLEKHGYTVDFSTQEADPQIGQDLQTGKIDMLWQYTGTELQKYLNVDKPPTDLDAAFEAARAADDAKGLCWIGKAPMDDTNGLAIRSADASKFGSTLTQFTSYISAHSDVKICILSEFKSRADGVPGLAATYGPVWTTYNYTEVGKTAESNLKAGDCDAGEVFTTDSGIAANNLAVLQDDKKLFPPDNVGLIVRSTVLQQHPDIAAVINPIAAKITTGEITKLNKQVEIDNAKPEDVAKAWLSANGF